MEKTNYIIYYYNCIVDYYNFDRPLCIFFFGLAFFIGKKWMKTTMENKNYEDSI